MPEYMPDKVLQQLIQKLILYATPLLTVTICRETTPAGSYVLQTVVIRTPLLDGFLDGILREALLCRLARQLDKFTV